jgi:transmembrane sensor
MPDPFNRLLDAYLAGEATETEVNELFDYIRNWPREANRQLVPESRRRFEALMARSETPAVDPAVSQRMLDRLLKEIRPAPVLAIRSRRWLRLAVAAVLLGLLGTGAWWLVGINRPPATVTVSATDVPPGTNKAVLTLGNGAKIQLDSGSSGLVAQQGSALVRKLAVGRLTYDLSAAKGGAVLYNTLSTPRGGQYQLVLPDGTKVWLNALSSLRFPTAFTGDSREVELTGEAYFEVAHRDRQPFRVHAGQTLVEDLGTRFDVNAYTDEPDLKTTLLQGAVRVDGRMLAPGEEAAVDKGGQVRIRKDIDPDEVLAWKNGEFVFNRLDMAAILRQVSRWYDVDIVNPTQPVHRTFSGIVSRHSNLSEVMKILEQAGIRFKVEGKKMILSQ